MYQARLLDYYKNQSFRGALEHPDFSSGAYNPSCGDRIAFTGHIADGCIAAIAFESEGCVISQAAAALLCERVQSTPIARIAQFAVSDMKNLLGIELGPTRLKCALLSLEALQGGLSQLKVENA